MFPSCCTPETKALTTTSAIIGSSAWPEETPLSLKMTKCPLSKLSRPLEPSRQLHLLFPQQGLSMPRKPLRLKLPLCMCPRLRSCWQLALMNLQKALNEGMTEWLAWSPERQRPMVPESVILLECAGLLDLCP